ncbi:response regulator transcription factor [Gottfriedia solisilvae]|uniref:response regulator transcription factor n=1 Tax=Gottfriedia solisilvae TaxID=1516104 RepID=UPI003D2F265C
MLATKSDFINRKNNTVIFVESLLFLSGICRILEYYQIVVERIPFFDDLFQTDCLNSIFICEVASKDMETKTKSILKNDSSTKVIIIKDELKVNEIEAFVDLGVKGCLQSDLDEVYLVMTVKQVHLGNLFIDYRFTNEIFREYKSYKKIYKQKHTVDLESINTLLTRREYEILKLLAEGCTNNQISERLYISEKTVKNHVSNILAKMQVQDRLNAVIKGVRHNWIKIDAC